MRKSLVLGLALLAAGAAQATVVDFEEFFIRNHNSPLWPTPTHQISAPWDTDMDITENGAGDGFSAMTPRGGQKVGYGTNAFNGFQLNDLHTVDWEQLAGPSNKWAYLNIWVTDGFGNYAIIASENDYRGDDFSVIDEWKVFEFGGVSGNLNWLFDSGVGTQGVGSPNNQYLLRDDARVTLADLSDNVKIFSGEPFGSTGVSTGAPQGGYGFNLIWGDTAANFTDGPYSLNNLTVEWNTTGGVAAYEAGNLAPVPEPATMTLLGLGLAGLVVRSRRKRA